MNSVVKLSSAMFPEFIATHPAAVIHFDASWNNRTQIQLNMAAAAIHFGDSVGFAEVDVDAELELAISIPIANVPTVAYYLEGRLIAACVGVHQDVEARTELLLSRRSIGDLDGTKNKWIAEPPVWPKPTKRWCSFGSKCNQQVDAAGIAMLVLAIPPWSLVIIMTPNSTGFGDGPDRYVIAPIVLIGITAAIQRLFRHRTNAWPASAFLSGYGILLFLLLLACLA